jgi:hypothetical protein
LTVLGAPAVGDFVEAGRKERAGGPPSYLLSFQAAHIAQHHQPLEALLVYLLPRRRQRVSKPANPPARPYAARFLRSIYRLARRAL